MRDITAHMKWQNIIENVWRFQDSCNVYAVRGPDGLIMINAGTGAWLKKLGDLPIKPSAILLTHYFRDHAAGAVLAAQSGIPIYCAEYDQDILCDPQQHFRERETYIIYDNLWDLFAPIEPIDIAGVMLDYSTTPLAGLDIQAIPLPGVTMSHTGYGVTLGGRRIIFCGEAIHSPGRLARITPLQYNYNDLPGVINCYYSAQVLRDDPPDALMPSLGEPILEQTDVALEQLQTNLQFLAERRPDADQQFAAVHHDKLIKISDHVWRCANSNAQIHFIISDSDSGKAMAIDYGYSWANIGFQAYSKPARRRAFKRTDST